MHIRITIDCYGEAFDYDPMAEVADILQDAIDKLQDMPVGSAENLYDTNGNRVGQVAVLSGESTDTQ